MNYYGVTDYWAAINFNLSKSAKRTLSYLFEIDYSNFYCKCANTDDKYRLTDIKSYVTFLILYSLVLFALINYLSHVKDYPT